MKIDELIVCPKCKSTKLKVKREATYLYTYTLNQEEMKSETDEALPFLFDYREQLKNYEYVECEDCHNRFSCEIDDPNSKVKLTILQKAIRSDYETNPGFWG